MHKPKVMIVEDDEELNEVLQYNLTRAGYDVLPVLDGDEAVLLFGRELPDLVLLDIMLPARDGWDVLGYMSTRPELREIPVIIFTARSSREDFDRAREFENFSAYFVKPYATEDVLVHIQKVLGDRGAVSR